MTKFPRQRRKAAGMSCGHIALDKLGAHIERYYATELDKYAIQTTQINYPATEQLGDAFVVRREERNPWNTSRLYPTARTASPRLRS